MDPLHIVALSVTGTLGLVGIIYCFIIAFSMKSALAQNNELMIEMKQIVPANVHILNQLHAQQEDMLGGMLMGGEEELEEGAAIGFHVEPEEDEEWEMEDEE